jgi:nicotinate-nucleotide pyrophosphorylase (carboxylating)
VCAARIATVSPSARTTGDIVPRTAGVLAGAPIAAAVFDLVDRPAVDVAQHATDGSRVEHGRTVLTVTGFTRPLLTAERTALSLISHLSIIATTTRHWVGAVAGTGSAVRDTRKALPDSAPWTSTPSAAATGSTTGWGSATRRWSRTTTSPPPPASPPRCWQSATPREIPLEVECDTLDQVREGIHAGVQLVLLDNFALDQIAAAVARNPRRWRPTRSKRGPGRQP